MKKIYLSLALLITSLVNGFSQTMPTPASLPLNINFGTANFTPPVANMAAWTGSGTRPYTSQTVAENSDAGADAGVSNATPASGSSGANYGHAVSGDGRLTILQSGNTTNGTTQAVVAINTTGLSSVNVKYDLGLFIVNPRSIGLALQYRVGSTGAFTTISGSPVVYSNTSSNGGDVDGPTDLDNYDFNLPAAALNESNVQVRFITWNPSGTGARSAISIDNISITSGTPLPPCTELTAQPMNLMLAPASTTVTGTFNLIPAATTVVNYLVVRSSPAALSASPLDGEIYDPGETVNGGNGIAVEINTDGSFTDINLMPGTDYFYTVFAIEDQNCSGGPNYNQLAPLSRSTTTTPLAACIQPDPPTALFFAATNTTISGTFSAPTPPANRYLVIRNTMGIGTFTGTINDGINYTPGSVLGNGTVVSYLTNLSFTATGLTINKTYDFYIFSANTGCTGEPDYNTNSLNGTFSTTNNTGGIPTGYYSTAAGLSCGPLKTALFNIIKPTSANPSPDYNGICTIYPTTDFKVSDFGAYNVIWDMYSDNPTGPDPYEFEYGIDVDGCGGSPNNTPFPNGEGEEYNREHSFPRSWFGGTVEPMNSDIMHIFPTDKKVNAVRNNFPYGNVGTPSFLTMNGGKLGTNTYPGYGGTVFEPIDEYKGDLARAHFYMITAYEDVAISQNWYANAPGCPGGFCLNVNDFLQSPTDQPDPAARKLQIFDDWYMKLLYSWHLSDPVSQKEIDRNNAVYALQGNRNPYVDNPTYVDQVFSCSRALPVTLTDFIAQNNTENVLLKWNVTSETSFKQYEVERSTEGNNFVKIGTVLGQNLANYNFTDYSAKGNSILYYRLKMIDIDGRFKYSDVVVVRFGGSSNSTLIFPNPTNGLTKLSFAAPLLEASQIAVYDFSGRLVKQSKITIGTTTANLDLSGLTGGKYAIKISNSKQVINETVVVTK